MLNDASTHPRSQASGGRVPAGFTLVELIIALGMLIAVLGVTYGLIVDCLEADRTIDRLTLPDKIGEGIMALLRRDLSGTMYRKMGRRVFFVTDGGLPPDARDEVRFLSTVEPTPLEESGGTDTVSVTEQRGVIGVAYFLRPTDRTTSVPMFTLFRKEILELDTTDPLSIPGMNFEVYDKVAYLNVECFDGWSWYQDWDSELRIQEEEAELDAEAAASEGRVARVSDPQPREVPGLTTPGVDPEAETDYGELPPPAAVPVAVRVEVGIYVAVGGKLLTDAQGAPLVKIYSTIVPMLVAQRLPMNFEDELGGMEEGDIAGGGATGDNPMFGGVNPNMMPNLGAPRGGRPPAGQGRGRRPAAGGRGGRPEGGRGARPGGRGARPGAFGTSSGKGRAGAFSGFKGR